MFIERFEAAIDRAYENADSDMLTIIHRMQVKAQDLAMMVMHSHKLDGAYSVDQVVSKAGDIINCLTIILHNHNKSLESALSSNLNKLKEKGRI